MPSSFAKRNVFNRSHSVALTCEMGKLVPFLCEEVVPGDDFRINAYSFVRLAPMLAPIFARVNMWIHYFFVPNRLIWKDFEEFITNGLASGSTTVVPPTVKVDTSKPVWQVGSLADYLGIPVSDKGPGDSKDVVSPNGMDVSALPFRAYNKIYNDWYLAEFLQDPVALSTDSGADAETSLALLNRAWPRDYYTSALPFTQLGDPVTVPVATDVAPVKGVGGIGFVENVSPSLSGLTLGRDDQSGQVYLQASGVSSPVGVSSDGSKSGLVADLSNAMATSVLAIRNAFQLQRILERKARNGNRYVEYIASTFGVRSPDARLQRAEFLGGGRTDVMVSEVLQTSSTDSTSPQGNMSGHGMGAAKIPTINKAFTEHGFVIGILSIMPKAAYYQGLEPMWSRDNWTRYLQPELAHIGEQPIYKDELVMAPANKGVIFGYQPRYEEYRRKLSRVAGDMRTNMAYWHMARKFGQADVPLNGEFIQSNPTKRIFAAEEQADRPCWIQLLVDEKVIRPLPKYGNPGLIDH